MYRTGIIGCGKVAQLHAQAFQNLQGCDFLAVSGTSLEKAEDFASNFGIKPYDNITEMIKKNNIDVVSICTPHPNHLAPALEALEAGANIIVEKPLASTLEDCDAIINAARYHNKKLAVISQRRFYAPVQRVKKAIEDGKIGKPALGTVNMLGWRDENYYQLDSWRGTWKHEGGGVLVNQAPHQLDLLLWMMGEVEEVYGTWKNVNHPYIEVDDTALAIIKFKNGGLGNIIVSNSQKPGIFGKIQIHGTNGSSVGVQTEGGAMFIAGISGMAEAPVNDLWTIPGEENMLEEWIKSDTDFFNSIDPRVYYIERQLQDFLEAITLHREPLVNGEEGRKTVELFTAIYRSKRDNCVVKFPLAPEIDRFDFDGRVPSK